MFGGMGSASAAPAACDMIGDLLYSTSLVWESQTVKTDEDLTDILRDLNGMVGQISRPDLMPPETSEMFTLEGDVVFTYLSTLREAISGAEAGHVAYAKALLKEGPPPDFIRSLESLETSWQCQTADAEPPSERGDLTQEALYAGSHRAAPERVMTDQSSPALGSLRARARPSTSGTVLQELKLDGVLTEGSFKLFFLIVALILGLTLFHHFKGSKKRVARENRRLVHLPVNIRMGPVDYEMTMVDISMNGFKIQHPGVIQRQGPLSVNLAEAWHEADIKWTNNLFAGVRFKRPLTPRLYARVVESSLGHEEAD